MILVGILAAYGFTPRGHDTYRFTVVIVSGLPSDASAFSLTSLEA